MKQPEIRFNGFSDEWVEKKLGDISKIQTGSSNAKDASDQGEYPFYVRSDDVKRSNKYLFDGEAILIPGEGRIGEIFHHANGKFDFHQRVYAISSFQDLCGTYLINVLRKNFGHHAKKYSVKATVDSLRLPIIQQFPIQLPNLPEQQKIGALFSKYDAIIALREQKLEELNDLKKGLLQQMFDDGHKPQVRFSGFNDEWVEKKLGDVTEIVMGQSPHSANYTDNPQDYILVQGNADMKNGYVKPRVWTKKITKTVDENYLILGVRAPVGVVGRTEYPVVLGRGVAGIKGTNFLYQVLKRLKEIGYWNTMSTGSTFESINSKDIKNTKIQLPTFPEQQKIGQLFKQLDDRISNGQTKIEQLKAQKQGLLQRML